MGAAGRPDGHTLTVDSCSLLRDDVPWLPVMGEMHYARYPESEWLGELLKMKAGGIDIVSTYVFWIHHEEIEGTFDWSEQRSLRRFVELCRTAGLLAMVRCGPWCHGEVRNGGLPDWVLAKGVHARTDDARYLAHVRRLYGQIATQLDGLLWKHGGPVIGIQCENEFGGPAEHLLTLKQIAHDAGLDVPLYTRTGWPDLKTSMPFGEFLPLFGSYVEGFWDRDLTPMPAKYREAFFFTLSRMDDGGGTAQLGPRGRAGEEADRYPYFCCEIGGGMERSYHRRIRVAPEDVDTSALVRLGAGNNLQGYYMFHGGSNPDGRLTTLQESQATGYWNDMPVKSYDFQAPLGQYGQIRSHYHLLRRVHMFLQDYGTVLARFASRFPEIIPASADDKTTLRFAARTDGRAGFLFVNNYQRLLPMAAHTGIQFRIKLNDRALLLPAEPLTVPADSAFFWPFNLDFGGVRLIYATAQPICRLEDEGMTYFVFAEIPGVLADFTFERAGTNLIETHGTVTRNAAHLRAQQLRPSTGAAIRLRAQSGGHVCFVLLNHDDSLSCWKGRVAGRQRLLLTPAGVAVNGSRVHLTAWNGGDLALSMLPAPRRVTVGDNVAAASVDGLFRRFAAPHDEPSDLRPLAEPIRAAGPRPPVTKGSQGVAEAPSDEDFAGAGVWRLTLPQSVDQTRDLLLRVHYIGDVARLYLDGRLVLDNFYDGSPFEIGLKRHAPAIYRGELLLKILPLRKDAPIYLPQDAWPDFGVRDSRVTLSRIEMHERRHATFELA
jgi:beta-galactosidase